MQKVRQKNVFITAMEHYGTVLRLTAVSEESAGLSAQRMAYYQESVAGKTAMLTANFQSFYQTLLNSSVVKFLIDAASLIVKFSTAVGGFPVIVPLAIGALKLFGPTVGIANTALALGSKVSIGLAQSLFGIVPAAESATGVMAALQAASGLFIVALGAMAVVGVITYLNNLSESYSNLTKKVTDAAAALESTRSEYDKLIGKSNRTEDEEKYLRVLAQEIELETKLLNIAEKKAYNAKYGARGGDITTQTAKNPIEQLFAGMQGKETKSWFTPDWSAVTDAQTARDNAPTETTADIANWKKLDEQLVNVKKSYMDTYKELKGYSTNPEITMTAEDLAFVAAGEAYLAEQASRTNSVIADQVDGFTTVTNVYAKLNAGVEDTVSLYNEMNTNGYLSIKTVQGMIENGNEYVNLLYVENGVYKLKTNTMEAGFAAEKAGAIASLTTKKVSVQADIDATTAFLNNTKMKMIATLALAQADKITTDNAIENIKLRARARGENPTGASTAQLSSLNAQLNAINNAIGNISGLTLKGYTDSMNGAAKAASGLSDATQRQIDLMEQHRKNDAAVYDKLINQYKTANDLLDEQNTATEKAIELSKARQALTDAQNQKNTRVYTSQGWKFVSDPAAISKATETLSGLERESALDAAKAGNQAQIDKWTDEKERRDLYYDEKIASLKGYANGGEVDFTGVAKVHGSDSKPEYMLTSNEYPALKSLMQKWGISGTPSSVNNNGSNYNNYGAITIQPQNQETLDSLLMSTLDEVKTGK